MSHRFSEHFKYAAFISYSHHDRKWGEWLENEVETYKVPKPIVGMPGRDGPISKKIGPVCRDRAEFAADPDLRAQIKSSINQSAYLIVICSPHSAKSEWVNEEILEFKRLNRDDHILALIVDGEPGAADKLGIDSDLECYPPALKTRTGPDGKPQPVQLLAADARKQGDREKNAKLKIIAGMLGVNFDLLKQRDKERLIKKSLKIGAAVLGALAFYLLDMWDRGYLDVDSAPSNTSIILDADSTQYGAVMHKLSLRAHNMFFQPRTRKITASAPNHWQVSQAIEIERGKMTSKQFWLDNAFEREPYVSEAIQNGKVLIPVEGDTILAHDEMEQVIFLSTSTGKIIDRFYTRLGTKRSFLDFDVGGDIGKVILSGLDDVGQGLEVLAIQAGPEPKELWRWQGGEAVNLGNPAGISAITLPMPTGETVFALAGRDGRAYFIDAVSGPKHSDDIKSVQLSTVPLSSNPLLVSAPSQYQGTSVLTAFFRIKTGDSTTLQGASFDFPSGEPRWKKKYLGAFNGCGSVFMMNGLPHVALWGDSNWQVVDASTGELRGGGVLPGKPMGAPAVANLEGHDSASLVFQFKDPSLGVITVRANDGGQIWHSQQQTGESQVMGSDGAIMLTADGALLVNLKNALAALDPHDGHVIWKHQGKLVGMPLIGDWDGDGQAETIATLSETGGATLYCLNGQGVETCALDLAEKAVTPWGFIKPKYGTTNNLLVHRPAGLIGLIHAPKGVRKLWVFKAAEPIQATPVVATIGNNRTVVVEAATWENNLRLRAFNGLDGNVLWSSDEHITGNHGVTLADIDGNGVKEVVAISGMGNDEVANLLVYDLLSGVIKPNKVPLDVKGWIQTTPIIADFQGKGKLDVVFSAFNEKKIVMVDGRTGRTIWQHPVESQYGLDLLNSLIKDIDGDGLSDVVANSWQNVDDSQRGAVFGLSGKDGKLLWISSIGDNGWSKPEMADLDQGGGGQILVVGMHGIFSAFDAKTGKLLWRPDIDSHVDVKGSSANVVEDGKSFMKVSGHPVAFKQDGKTIVLVPTGQAGVVAFDWATRSELWRSPKGYPAVATPVLMDFNGIKNGGVVVASATGDVWVLKIDDGSQVWHDHVNEGPIVADPVVADLNGDNIVDIIIAGLDMKFQAINGRIIPGNLPSCKPN